MKKTYRALALSLVCLLGLGACAASDTGPSYAEPGYDYADGGLNNYEMLPAGEAYLVIDENNHTLTEDMSTLTFSLKVDTAAYTNVSRYIQNGSKPPKDAVRTEELINYFSYDAPLPITDGPFGIGVEIGPSPFDREKALAFIRVRTEAVPKAELPPSNLTFLIDTSGSMDSYDKLPLLKEAFSLLVETLDERDTVSIVTYAGSSQVILDSVSGDNRAQILDAIRGLEAYGSTGGEGGIYSAYRLAQKNYDPSGNNRVILATDGDFNVGTSNVDELKALISEKKDSGVYLSVLGFGTGNIREDIMETLAANGNGNYSYINTKETAKKVLVDELGGNLFTVADDVKAQLDFNADTVEGYRLIGYENRKLSNEDFDNDAKDAGEIGVGCDVVVLVELELRDNPVSGLAIQALSTTASGDDYFTLRIRYKDPGALDSRLIECRVGRESATDSPSTDFGFAASVAAFGHLLRDSDNIGEATYEDVVALARANIGDDVGGYRSTYLDLLDRYGRIAG